MDKQRELSVSILWIAIGAMMGVVAAELTSPLIAYGIGGGALLAGLGAIAWCDRVRLKGE